MRRPNSRRNGAAGGRCLGRPESVLGGLTLATSNPAFSQETFAGFEQVYGPSRSAAMTVQGTIGKTFALLGILTATALWSWNATQNHELSMGVLPAAGIGGFVLAMITIFKPNFAPW